MLLIARREEMTLTGVESARLGHHVEACSECQQLVSEAGDGDWVWIARIPRDALDDPDMLALPTVDPACFDIDGPIARGGMGMVLKARDRRLGRAVAIKELSIAELRGRFEREAVVTARLQHPAIVPIYEAGTWPDGSPFYTMRLVEGDTLARAIRSAATLAERLALLPNLIAVTEAIAYAHSLEVIHRDLKPHNILIGEFGETVVIDWGLAKIVGEPDGGDADAAAASLPDLTIPGEVLGTPCYIAPEQAAGRSPDQRADVYSLGAILYALLAGHAPYLDEHDDESGPRLVEIATEGPPTPIAALAPESPADLLAICDRAMARDPADRYPSARELAAELRRFEAGQLIATRSYGLRELLWRWIARHRAAVAVATIAVVVLATVAVIAVRGIASSRDDARAAETRAIERSDELVFRQAADSLDGDPTRTIAWLKQLRPGSRFEPAAALLAAEAIRLGVHEQVFDAHSAQVERVGFGADGATVFAIAGAQVRTWDLASGAVTDRVEAEPAPPTIAALGGDRVLVYVDGERRWSIVGADGAAIASVVIDGIRPGPGLAVAAPRRGGSVALSVPGIAYLWRYPDGGVTELVPKKRPPAGRGVLGALAETAVTAMAYDDADGRLTLGMSDGSIRVIDPETGELVCETDFLISAPSITALTHGAGESGRLLAFGNQVGAVVIERKCERLGRVRRLRGHHDAITALAFSSDGRRLVSAGADRTVRIHDRRSQLAPIEVGAPRAAARAASAGGRSPDRRWVALDRPAGIAIQTAGGAEIASRVDRLRSGGGDSIVWSADSAIVALVVSDNELLVFEPATGAWHSLETHVVIDRIAVASRPRRVIASSRVALVIWDLDTGVMLLRRLPEPLRGPRAIAVSADQSRVIIATDAAAAEVPLPEFSAGMIREATRAEIDDRGVARTPRN